MSPTIQTNLRSLTKNLRIKENLPRSKARGRKGGIRVRHPAGKIRLPRVPPLEPHQEEQGHQAQVPQVQGLQVRHRVPHRKCEFLLDTFSPSAKDPRPARLKK